MQKDLKGAQMQSSRKRIAALVVAAGKGERAGSGLPKQYRKLGGLTVLRRTLDALVASGIFDAAVVVTDPTHEVLYRNSIGDFPQETLVLLPPAKGGATRQESVRNGLEALASIPGGPPETVMIHDAARPFVASDTIHALADCIASGGYDAAIAAVPVVDTLKRSADGISTVTTVQREGLWRAMTPQAFRFDTILDLHRRFSGQRGMTDDAALAEAAGIPVKLVACNDDNFKITTASDFEKAAFMIRQNQMTRTGIGFDVHRFGPGDHVMLGGLAIPHTQGLEGHSDADVLLHAITDAILGAIAAGDIGSHFPPSDPQWKGASSDRFLRHAADLVRNKGGQIVSIDATVIGERPKVGPHRDEIASSVAAILDIPASRIGIKATTTERLGFTGRGEGLAAQAVATVTLPQEDDEVENGGR